MSPSLLAWPAASLALLLSACGGGGGGASPPMAAAPVPAPSPSPSPSPSPAGFRDIGVACVKGGAGNSFTTYWTMELATPR